MNCVAADTNLFSNVHTYTSFHIFVFLVMLLVMIDDDGDDDDASSMTYCQLFCPPHGSTCTCGKWGKTAYLGEWEFWGVGQRFGERAISAFSTRPLPDLCFSLELESAFGSSLRDKFFLLESAERFAILPCLCFRILLGAQYRYVHAVAIKILRASNKESEGGWAQ